MAKKKEVLTIEEKLEKALVPDSEQPYKVPSNWVWTTWGRCGELIAGSGFKNEYQGFTDYEIPFYKVGSLKHSDINGHIYDVSNTISEEIRIKLNAKLIPEKSLLFAKIGEAIRLNRRSINDNPCCIDNNMMAFIPNVISYKYAYFWSLNVDLYDYTNATTVPAIRKSDLENIKIPLPPRAEQKRIVERIESLFSKLDEAKELAQSALDSFENRKSAILHKAFTGELTKKWREENGVGFDSWEETTLGKACIVNPKRINVKEYDDELDVTFVPMPSVSDINGIIDIPLTEKLSKVKKGYTNFSENDVIFAKITPCMENGKSAVVGKLVNNIGFGSTEFHVLRCDDKTNNIYIYHLVRWQKFRDEAKSVMTGAVGQQRVPKQFLEEYALNLPTLPEQVEIVRILDSIFEKETVAKDCANVIEQIDLMKKSILARAFRGQLGTNDKNDENALELLKEILK